MRTVDDAAALIKRLLEATDADTNTILEEMKGFLLDHDNRDNVMRSGSVEKAVGLLVVGRVQ
jgi:hypothetical protein